MERRKFMRLSKDRLLSRELSRQRKKKDDFENGKTWCFYEE